MSVGLVETGVRLLATNGLATIFAAGVYVILARVMGSAQFGAYVYAMSWAAVLVTPALWGLDTAALRLVAAYRGLGAGTKLSAFIAFCSWRLLYVSAAAAGLLSVVALMGAGDSPHSRNALLAASLLLPINSYVQFNGSVLQACGREVAAQLFQGIVRPLIFLALVALMSTFQRGLSASEAILLTTAAAAITLCCIVRVLRTEGVVSPDFQPRGLRGSDWTHARRYLGPLAVAQTVLGQGDVVLVGLLTDTTQAGFYAVGSRLAGMVTFGITAINGTLAPRIAALFAKGELRALQATVRLSARAVLVYSVPTFVVLSLVGSQLLGLFGPEFREAYRVLLILAVAQMLIASAGSVGSVLTMTGHQRDATVVLLCSAAAAAVGSLVLIPRYGAQGAATATLIAVAFRTVALSFFVSKRLGINAAAFGATPVAGD